MAREQQQARHADEFVVGQLVGVFAHQHADDVLARCHARTPDQIEHVRARLARQIETLGDGQRQVQLLVGAALEALAVGVGHAEQFADHQRGDRQRERLDEVGG